MKFVKMYLLMLLAVTLLQFAHKFSLPVALVMSFIGGGIVGHLAGKAMMLDLSREVNKNVSN